MGVTQKDVAERLGLSRSLVGGVLENRSTVWASAGTRRRIIEAAREMNYRPHTAAKSLRSGKTYTAVLTWHGEAARVSEISEVMTTLAVRLGRAGYELRVRPYASQEEALSCLRDIAQASACDVFVLWDACQMVEEQGELLQSFDVPFVVRGRFEESHPEWHQIDFDHEAMMERAVHELVSRGHRRIFYVGYDSLEPYALKLKSGFLSSMHERYGRDISDKCLFDVCDGPEAPAKVFGDWMGLPVEERPTAAVIGAGNAAWRGIERALAKSGRRIGYDDGEFAIVGISHGDMPLTFGHALAYQSANQGTIAKALASTAVAIAGKADPLPACVQRIMPDLTPMWCLNMPFVSL